MEINKTEQEKPLCLNCKRLGLVVPFIREKGRIVCPNCGFNGTDFFETQQDIKEWNAHRDEDLSEDDPTDMELPTHESSSCSMP